MSVTIERRSFGFNVLARIKEGWKTVYRNPCVLPEADFVEGPFLPAWNSQRGDGTRIENPSLGKTIEFSLASIRQSRRYKSAIASRVGRE